MKSKIITCLGIISLISCGCTPSQKYEEEDYIKSPYTNKLYEYAAYDEKEDVLTSYQINFVYHSVNQDPPTLCFEKVYYKKINNGKHEKETYEFTFDFVFVGRGGKDIKMTFLYGSKSMDGKTTYYGDDPSLRFFTHDFEKLPSPVVAHCSGTTNEDLKVHFDKILDFKDLNLPFRRSGYETARSHNHTFDEEWSLYSHADDVNDGYLAKFCYCGYSTKTPNEYSSSHMRFDEKTQGDYHYYSLHSFEEPEDTHPTQTGKIIIPQAHNGLPVKTIRRSAFRLSDLFFRGINEIYVPKTISAIGTQNLESGYGEDNEPSFTYSGVTEFNINVVVDEDNEYYKSIAGAVYTKDEKILIYPGPLFYKDKQGNSSFDYVVNNNVEIIGQKSFMKSPLTKKTFWDNVKTLRNDSFSDCSYLTEVIINASIENIGYMPFRDCYKLKEITYKGTTSQWASIKKNKDWNVFSQISVVHCSYGDVQVTQI